MGWKNNIIFEYNEKFPNPWRKFLAIPKFVVAYDKKKIIFIFIEEKEKNPGHMLKIYG